MAMVGKVDLGKGRCELSRIVFGVWRLLDTPEGKDPKWVAGLVEQCIELGLTSFDHADLYGDYLVEEAFGKVLGESPSLRSHMQLITKAGIKLVSPSRPGHKIKSYDTGKKHLTESLETSLKSLKTDHVDLFLIHRPDPFMDPEETGAAMDELVSSGKARSVGVSNFLPWQIDLLQSFMKEPLVTNQIEINPLCIESFLDGTIGQCQKLGIKPMAWSPFAGGELFNKATPEATRVMEKIEGLGRELGATPGQTILSWMLKHPAGIVPIMGTMKVERIKELAQAVDISWTKEQWFDLWSAAFGGEVP